ncbi:ester cyclase [Streptomyces sp. NPDC001858]
MAQVTLRGCASTSAATQTGTFLGRPATGRAVTYTEVAFLRFDEVGRIAEGWFLCDEFNLAAQLGAASWEDRVDLVRDLAWRRQRSSLRSDDAERPPCAWQGSHRPMVRNLNA